MSRVLGTLVFAAVLVGGWWAWSPAQTAQQHAAVEPGYSRSEFGDGWHTTQPGCDVRDLILARDLEPDQRRAGGPACDVVAGTLLDPYSGAVITGPARDLDVDHLVPLAYAWRHGASSWSRERREAFANDPAELRTTTAHANRVKSDSGLGEWLPPVGACDYADAFDAVADAYGLADAARDAQVVEACDGA